MSDERSFFDGNGDSDSSSFRFSGISIPSPFSSTEEPSLLSLGGACCREYRKVAWSTKNAPMQNVIVMEKSNKTNDTWIERTIHGHRRKRYWGQELLYCRRWPCFHVVKFRHFEIEHCGHLPTVPIFRYLKKCGNFRHDLSPPPPSQCDKKGGGGIRRELFMHLLEGITVSLACIMDRAG